MWGESCLPAGCMPLGKLIVGGRFRVHTWTDLREYIGILRYVILGTRF